jgi:hypothetical protein
MIIKNVAIVTGKSQAAARGQFDRRLLSREGGENICSMPTASHYSHFYSKGHTRIILSSVMRQDDKTEHTF